MKKILVAVAVVALFASCKKDYTCDYPDSSIYTDQDYDGLSNTNADVQELACTTSGGTWSEK